MNRQQMGQAVRARVTQVAAEKNRELTRSEQLRVARSIWREAGALDSDDIRRGFIRVARRAELSDATCPKSWRHSFATLLQDANVDPLIRQITMGHKPVGGNGALGMTSVYTHTRPETQAREIERALRTWPRSLEFIFQQTQPTHGGV